MLQHKQYLALQIWFTSVATWLLGKACLHYDLPSDLNTFLPGVSVAISHIIILCLTLLRIPSIEEVRKKNAVSNARKMILAQLKDPNLTDEERQRCQEALSFIRSKEVTRSLAEVDQAYSILTQADTRDLEEG